MALIVNGTTAPTGTDLNTVKTNLTSLAMKQSLVKYSLVDMIVDEYIDAAGIDAGNSTNDILGDGGGVSSMHVRGSTVSLGSGVVKEFIADNTSWSISPGSIIDKMIVIGGGGAGGQRTLAGQDKAGAGGGGSGWVGAVSYTISSGVTFANVSVGAGGKETGQDRIGGAGGTSSIVFGNDLTLTATGGSGGAAGAGAQSGGSGGTGSKSGTSNASVTTLALTGGVGGNGQGNGTGGTGDPGASGSLNSTTYRAAGGGGGGSGDGAAGAGGYGLVNSFSGGGGAGGGDGETGGSGKAGGSGLQAGGTGSSVLAAGDAASGITRTHDGKIVYGGTGTLHNPGYDGSLVERRDKNNAGGGGLFGGGGGGIGDGGVGISTAHGAQGFVHVDYRPVVYTIADLILQSTDTEAEAQPTKADMVIMIEDAGSGVGAVQTHIKGWISRNSGTTFTQGTLVDEGDWGTDKRILAFHDLDISGQPADQTMCYKITTHSASAVYDTRIHATSFGWK